MLGHLFVFLFGSSEVGDVRFSLWGPVAFGVLGVGHWWSLVLGMYGFLFLLVGCGVVVEEEYDLHTHYP